MSLTTSRAAILAALETVAALNAYTTVPTVLTAGDALLRFDGLEHTTATAYEARWSVFVMLGATYADGVAAMDPLIAPLIEALSPVAYVVDLIPTVFGEGGNTMNAIQIRLIRE